MRTRMMPYMIKYVNWRRSFRHSKKAIEKARVKNQLKMAGRSGRVVGKGGVWRNGRDKNVIDFHNSVQLPNDMISTLTLRQRQK